MAANVAAADQETDKDPIFFVSPNTADILSYADLPDDSKDADGRLRGKNSLHLTLEELMSAGNTGRLLNKKENPTCTLRIRSLVNHIKCYILSHAME